MSQFISLELAQQMKALFQQQREAILAPAFQGKDINATSETFSAADIQTLLNQPDCSGLRVYYGMSEDLKIHAILVATNNSNMDILDLILEEATRCPPICPPPPGL